MRLPYVRPQCVLMQYKLDLWSKYGFDLKRLLLPQLPLDRHLNIGTYIESLMSLLRWCLLCLPLIDDD